MNKYYKQYCSYDHFMTQPPCLRQQLNVIRSTHIIQQTTIDQVTFAWGLCGVWNLMPKRASYLIVGFIML